MTICMLVCKDWYHAFLPQLWRDVAVYDFDYAYYDDKLFGPNEEDICGRHMAHKYSHLIRSMATQSTKSLIDLGPGCVNLERLCVKHSESSRFVLRQVTLNKTFRWLKREKHYGQFFDATVLKLVQTNPNLRVVKYAPAHDEFVDAIGNLNHLEELWVTDKFDIRIMLRRNTTLKLLLVFSSLHVITDTTVTPVDVVLEKIIFTSFSGLKTLFDHIASCNHLRALFIYLATEDEVKGLERIIQKVGSTLQELSLTCAGSFSGIARIISKISKLRSFTVNDAPLHLEAIQAVIKYHRESLEIFENSSCRPSDWTEDIVDSRVHGDQLEAIMRLCLQCPKLKVFSSQLISITIERLMESTWASMNNITSLQLAIIGFTGLEESERTRKSDELRDWLSRFERLQNFNGNLEGPDSLKLEKSTHGSILKLVIEDRVLSILGDMSRI
ncbi:hypothetical protein BGZ49_003382 [Haplosporangium sp. Z 27]|nr:hypothetical protein BGZ49_003382 [Haplosporangium sp. Z 27]